jgi:hypothetical protein
MKESLPVAVSALVILYIVAVSLFELIGFGKLRDVGASFFGERVMKLLEHNLFIYGFGGAITGASSIIFFERWSPQYDFGLFLMAIGWAFITLAIVRTGFFAGQWKAKTALLSLSVAVILLGAVVFLSAKHPVHGSQESRNPSKDGLQNITLESLFRSDFPNVFKFTEACDTLKLKDGERVPILCQEYADFQARTSYVGFYIPSTTSTEYAAAALADTVMPFIDGLRKTRKLQTFDSSGTSLDDLTFSGRVFIYYEWPLTLQQQAQLVSYFKTRHMAVDLRGPDYFSSVIMDRKLKAQSK